jgi:hypothetical protein
LPDLGLCSIKVLVDERWDALGGLTTLLEVVALSHGIDGSAIANVLAERRISIYE